MPLIRDMSGVNLGPMASGSHFALQRGTCSSRPCGLSRRKPSDSSIRRYRARADALLWSCADIINQIRAFLLKRDNAVQQVSARKPKTMSTASQLSPSLTRKIWPCNCMENRRAGLELR
jgi:hypothetical protein